jgi:nicotinate dehydrogenase subunit B
MTHHPLGGAPDHTPPHDDGSGTAAPASAEVWAGRRPGAEGAHSRLDDWLAITPDGIIMVYSGKVELGTGTRTALAQIVAEELEVPLARIQVVMGDTQRTPNEGYTAGSQTISSSGARLRLAAAEARQALLELAAARLESPIERLTMRDGVIAAGDRSVTYGELMRGQQFGREVTGAAPLKPVEAYRLVGTDAARADLPAKFTGQPAYVHDLRLPGMRHARMVRPPSPGASLLRVDDSALRAGVVVRLGSFVAVVAEREEEAVRGARQLRVTWREVAHLPAMADLHALLRHSPTREQMLVAIGDVETALGAAARQLRATYTQPFQAHASIGPSCAVAEYRDGQLTVWCSSQGVHQLRPALADLLALPPASVRVIYLEGAGGYGQNGADDVAADAAVLARELGVPVRVQWSREDEFLWEPKGPAMVVDLHAGLDEQGMIVAWDGVTWSPNHANRPRRALDLLAGQLIQSKAAPPRDFYLGGERNALIDYVVPHQRNVLHWVEEAPLRSSSMRSLGAFANTFANESFMDELAALAGAHPVAFRLRHLRDPRGRDVLNAAARDFNWRPPSAAGVGQGIAFARYENSEAYVATAAEVRVDTDSGQVTITRVVVAHDCGLIVNPDGVRQQIEGNVIQSLSRALKEEVHFDSTRITSVDWESYPILTFSETPTIEVVLIDRRDCPSVGAGEPASVTTAAAVANAIYAAVGVRLRQVPFTPARVRAALADR